MYILAEAHGPESGSPSAKRSATECFRAYKDRTDEGLDIVVVVRPAARDSDFSKMESAYRHLCGLHNIIKESK